MGLERVKYAGLLASQEEPAEIAQFEETATLIGEEAQPNEPVDVQVETSNKTLPNGSGVNTTRTTDNSTASDKRRKHNQRP
jgi:hypothetical protein